MAVAVLARACPTRTDRWGVNTWRAGRDGATMERTVNVPREPVFQELEKRHTLPFAFGTLDLSNQKNAGGPGSRFYWPCLLHRRKRSDLRMDPRLC